ncbi:GNAT family N-acetyltransferase [Aestuariibacter salexigens]|uniref:GNAT family N-acetyltransferase n=1 Tax=Aestuariibacter salexigens TaxID=226010 RepID=UPI00041FA76C|nr:GNAT family N-acetyltransferase [Aestuariibacter salexigens]
MDSCKAELTVTPDCLAGDFSTIVAQVDDHPAGFYTLAYSHPGSWSIEALFVSPVMMKKGIGSVLMQDVLQSAVQSKVHTLRIESDPHAVGFYQRFGAVQTGTVASGSIENRCLPLLEIKLPN